MRFAWTLLVLLSLPLLAGRAHAQTGRCTIAAERMEVAVNEAFRLDVSCEAQGAEAGMPELPDLSMFEVMSRQFSRPMQFTFGTGGTQQIVQSSSRVTLVLRGRREGRYDIGPARIQIAGRTVESNTITLSVGGSGASANPNAPPANPGAPPSGPLDGAVYDDNAFVRTVVDRREVALGQQVTVTYYLYVRSLATAPQVSQQPSTDGFWVHDLLDRNAPPEALVQSVGNNTFRVYTLRRFAAFPLRAGPLTLGAMELQVPVGNPLDMIFGGGPAAVTRASLPVTINVVEPEGAPAGLSRHVGTLEVTSTLDRAQIPTGDAVTLDLHLSGIGHVESTDTPTLNIPGLRILQPEVSQRTTVVSERVGGEKNVRWLIVAEQPGTYTIGPFRWAVWNTETQQWTTAEAPALTLTAAGNAVATNTPEATREEESIEAPTQDETAAFGPVRTESAFARRSTRIASTWWYRGGLAAGPLALVAFALVSLWRRRREQHFAANAGARQARDARKKLEQCAQALSAKDARAFYSGLAGALRGALEVRLGSSIGSLTFPELRRTLRERGMDAGLIDAIIGDLELAEMARFSSAGSGELEMKQAYEGAKARMGQIERFVPRQEDV